MTLVASEDDAEGDNVGVVTVADGSVVAEARLDAFEMTEESSDSIEEAILETLEESGVVFVKRVVGAEGVEVPVPEGTTDGGVTEDAAGVDEGAGIEETSDGADGVTDGTTCVDEGTGIDDTSDVSSGGTIMVTVLKGGV